jgi:GNAT superfamily N-acetyltransferase
MKPKSMVVRRASRSDATGILHCLAAAFEPYRADYTPAAYSDTTLHENTLQERFREMNILVAVEEGIVVGTVGASAHPPEGHLRGMAVLPDFAGRAVAAELLQEIERWLQSEGCTRVTLDTTEPLKKAAAFYEKHGYRRSGRVSDFYGMRLVEYEKHLTTPSIKTDGSL